MGGAYLLAPGVLLVLLVVPRRYGARRRGAGTARLFISAHVNASKSRLSKTFTGELARGHSPRHQVRLKSNRLTSLSNSNVPGLPRLFRRQVFAIARHRSSRACVSSSGRDRPAAIRLANGRIASRTLLRLFVGSPHALVTTSQCCTSAANYCALMPRGYVNAQPHSRGIRSIQGVNGDNAVWPQGVPKSDDARLPRLSAWRLSRYSSASMRRPTATASRPSPLGWWMYCRSGCRTSHGAACRR